MFRNARAFVRNAPFLVGSAKANQSTSSSASCWSCDNKLTEQETRAFFCPCATKVILPVNSENSYFDLFGLNVNYEVEKKDLVKKFRASMRQLHPDLFTLKSEVEKEYSSNYSSLMNKAFATLSSPIERGLYMLKLNKIDYKRESVHGQDEDMNKILMDIMELNEFIDEISETGQVEELEAKLNEIIRPFEEQLKTAFDGRDYTSAVEILSKMKYYQNVTERLEDLKLKFDIDNF